jgi:hypothetical protein
MTPEHIILQIEAFAKGHGIAPATVTSRAVGNSRLYNRMKNGGSCNVRIANKLIEFMAAHPVPDAEAATPSEQDAA